MQETELIHIIRKESHTYLICVEYLLFVQKQNNFFKT